MEYSRKVISLLHNPFTAKGLRLSFAELPKKFKQS